MIPTNGIQLSFLKDDFLRKFQKVIKGKTVSQVCEEVIKPLTKERACSYGEYLSNENPCFVKKATVFISYTWQYRFEEVLEAIIGYYEEKKCDLKKVFVWIDVFSINQHQYVNHPFEWWSSTFKLAIGSFQNTLMIFILWNDPIPLRRAWCIWEYYCTIDTKSRFDIALTAQGKLQCISDLCGDSDTLLRKMYGDVSSERSIASKTEDKDNIHQAIRAAVGFSQLDKLIFENFREWMIDTVDAYCKQLSRENNAFAAYAEYAEYALGNLYLQVSRYDEAEPIFLKSLKFFEENPLTLSCIKHSLGTLYFLLKQYDKAEKYITEVYQMHSIPGFPEYVDRSVFATILADIYYRQDKFDKAEDLALEAFERQKRILTKSDPHLYRTWRVLGNIFGKKGNWVEAGFIFNCCYILQKKYLGEKHPETVLVLGNISWAHFELGNLRQAKCFAEDCLQRLRDTVGQSHRFAIETAISARHIFDRADQVANEWKRLQHSYIFSLVKFGCSSQKVIHNLVDLLHVLAEGSEYDEIETLCLDWFKRMEYTHVSFPERLKIEKVLVNSYRSQRKYSEAIVVSFRLCDNTIKKTDISEPESFVNDSFQLLKHVVIEYLAWTMALILVGLNFYSKEM